MNTKTIIVRPRITEKASFKSENNVYVFEIAKNANKKEIAKAVRELYNVTPVKVATASTPAKKVFVRGKHGTKSAIKKAYVYLKKGEKIEVM